jgi:hypothetical protein
MVRVFVEARPKGRPEGSPIEDYVVEDHADHVLQTFKTQHEAIEWAKTTGHSPHVARVRHLNDKENPDHWRAAQASHRRPDLPCDGLTRVAGPSVCVPKTSRKSAI